MTKVPIRPRPHKPKPLPDHYQRLSPDLEGPHPVDLAVERRVRHAALRRTLRKLGVRIVKKLGHESRWFLDYEATAAEVQVERERAFFNLGFEHGAAEARVRHLRRATRLLHTAPVDRVAADVRTRLLDASLPTPDVLLVLAETLWIVALGQFECAPAGDGP